MNESTKKWAPPGPAPFTFLRSSLCGMDTVLSAASTDSALTSAGTSAMSSAGDRSRSATSKVSFGWDEESSICCAFRGSIASYLSKECSAMLESDLFSIKY